MNRASRNPSLPSPIEVDLHGLHAEQAENRIMQVLDTHAGRQGLEIRIIHGKGSGILEGIVDRIGRADPRVESVEKSFFNPGMTTLILSSKARSPLKHNPVDSSNLHHPIPPVRRKKRK